MKTVISIPNPNLKIANIPVSFTNDACKNCKNNPVNGGSGICNCILGTLVWT